MSTAAPAPAPVASLDHSQEAIVVRLGSSTYAFELAAVAEVGRVPSVTRVPGLPAWLAGVANWRGRILPVLDLRALLGVDAGGARPSGRLLVLTDGVIVVGMLVDAVDGTTALADVSPFPAGSVTSGSSLLSGQLPREDGPIALVDVGAVLRLRDGLPRGRRTA
jgi:chemotaxis signal transduction protein